MVRIDQEGRIVFRIELPRADSVAVVGAFTGWREQRIPMHRDEHGAWEAVVDPGPGEFLFRYHVDGRHWLLDAAAHGTRTSLDGWERSRVCRPPINIDPGRLAA